MPRIVIAKQNNNLHFKFVRFVLGMNQLMWYYADLEKMKCYHASDEVPDFDNQEKACSIWRRFAKYEDKLNIILWRKVYKL